MPRNALQDEGFVVVSVAAANEAQPQAAGRIAGTIPFDAGLPIKYWRLRVASEHMTELRIGDRIIRLMTGDITSLDTEAFVHDARPDLVLGAGYGGAIAVRGGPTVQEELKQLGPVKVGGAVVSSAGKMKARYIIHAVCPHFQEEDEERKLLEATRNALARADERGIARLAFPALGAGFYGIPAERSARVMLDAVARHLSGPTTLRQVVFCLLDSRQLHSFEAVLDELGLQHGSSRQEARSFHE